MTGQWQVVAASPQSPWPCTIVDADGNSLLAVHNGTPVVRSRTLADRVVELLNAGDPDDQTLELDDVANVVQQWITQGEGEPVVVTGAMLTWERVTYGEDGQQWRKFGYADLLQSGLAAAIGLLVAGKRQVMDDLFGEPEDEQ